jgi:hypothetical protein
MPAAMPTEARSGSQPALVLGIGSIDTLTC